MSAEQLFDKDSGIVEKSEVVVLRDFRHFPMYETDVINPYFVLFLNLSGTARIRYDMHEIDLKKNEIVCIMPNHVIRPLETSTDYRAMVLVLSPTFCKELPFHFFTHDFHKFHFTPAFPLTEEQMRFATVYSMMAERLVGHTKDELPHRHQVLLSYVSVCYELLNMCRREQDKLLSSSFRNIDLFNRFCNLVVEHYREEREVAFYAEKLMLTPKYFSKVIQDTVGMTASDWIEQYVATQAQNMLVTRPNMTVQEIGLQLGFTEQPSFCRFFKRLTGYTPRKYRQEHGGNS